MYRELEHIYSGVVDENGDPKRLSFLSYFDSGLCYWPTCPFSEDMKDVAPCSYNLVSSKLGSFVDAPPDWIQELDYRPGRIFKAEDRRSSTNLPVGQN